MPWSLFEVNELERRRMERKAAAEQAFIDQIRAKQALLRQTEAGQIETSWRDEDDERSNAA